ncbi:MAG: tetratricopeptide repeat protein [Nitrospirales bacterium]|nr:tetratricopeptide repeat protein [Nitrospirales bacterium]
MDAGTDRDVPQEGKAAEQVVTAPLNLDDEIGELKKLLADDPEDFQAQCRLGEVYFAKGMLDEALDNVSKAIEMAESIRKQMDNSLAMYYANRGTIQATKGDMDEAITQFRKALEIHPQDVLALFNLGRALFDRNEFMDAMPLFERLVDVTPDDPLAWFQLAKVYEKLDLRHISDLHTIDNAIAAYRRVLELDPHNLETAFALMEVYMNLRKPEEAIGVLEAAVEHNPDEPLAYYNLISTYEKIKRFTEADQTRERLKQRFASRRPAEPKDK